MSYDLRRFLDGQQPVYGQVLLELRGGRKRSHWMWFIFPQLRGQGRSAMAQHYGLASLAEADAYVRHPVLGARLVECSELVNATPGRSAHDIFGGPDDLKFHSCMTLFAAAPEAPAVFNAAIEKYFAGTRDHLTLEILVH